MGQMRCTWLPRPGASLWWVPPQGVDNQATAPTSPNPSQRYSRVAPLPSRSGRRPPCRPSRYNVRGQVDASQLIGYWPLPWSPGTIYIWSVFLNYTRGLVWWVGDEQCWDMGAMKAEGQARLEPPRNTGYAYTGYCVLAVGYGESGVMGIRSWHWITLGSWVQDVSTMAGVRERRRFRPCFAACVLLCTLVAALRRTGKPLLSACCCAGALLCLAPIPPANKRTIVRRRC